MPILEERIIYRVGRSSLVITLPRNWLKFSGLGAGDIVEVTGNGDLTIRPYKGQKKGSNLSAAAAQIGTSVSRDRKQSKGGSV